MLDNVDAALESAISSHEAGDLLVAGEKYLEILKADPSHPDANHNLGLLAVKTGQFTHALTLFQTAIKTNPRVEQFWISYIDTLIKQKSFQISHMNLLVLYVKVQTNFYQLRSFKS